MTKTTKVHLGIKDKKTLKVGPMCELEVHSWQNVIPPGGIEPEQMQMLKKSGDLCPVCYTVIEAYAQGRSDGVQITLREMAKLKAERAEAEAIEDAIPYMGPESKYNH